MKRSEIVNLIYNHIDGYMNPTTSYHVAVKLLEKIEKAGMLPPLNEQNYHHMDNEDRQVVNLAKSLYTWENEDDSGYDSLDVYFKKDDILIGIHAIGLYELNQYTYTDIDGNKEKRFSFFNALEVWGNEYDKDMNMLGRGSFRLGMRIMEDIIKEYQKEGWTLCSEEDHYEFNELLRKKNERL